MHRESTGLLNPYPWALKPYGAPGICPVCLALLTALTTDTMTTQDQ